MRVTMLLPSTFVAKFRSRRAREMCSSICVAVPRMPMLVALGSVAVAESVAVAVPAAVAAVAVAVELVEAAVELVELFVELLELVAEPDVLAEEPVEDGVLSASSSLGGGGTNMTARTSREIFRSKALAS